MNRSALLWIALLTCLAVVLAALVWISQALLRLDSDATEARQRAWLEEKVRLALWRIDSLAAPLVAQESVRPACVYRTFLPGGSSLDHPPAIPRVPSPLLGEEVQYVLLHFQCEPDGRLTAPRAPTRDDYPRVVPALMAKEAAGSAATRLAELQAGLRPRELAAHLPAGNAVPAVAAVELPDTQAQGGSPAGDAAVQSGRQEFARRSQAVTQTMNVMAQQNREPSRELSSVSVGTWSGGLMTPVWLNGRLFLARRVSGGRNETVQACWLDWPSLRDWLLASIDDLLPGSQLEPVADGDGDTSRMLVALPLRLVPGAAAMPNDHGTSALRLSLAVAWVGVLLAGVAMSVLIAGIVRLSRRRAAFVSAVTHELRTPLTTFQMYTEMLAEGMVPDPQQQHQYLATLRTEAARLTHLVENVLVYARLERGRAAGRIEPIDLGPLIDQLYPRLREHAARAGMELVLEEGPDVRQATIQGNASALEQILLNLVDNACKYAASASDRRIHLTVSRKKGSELFVRESPGAEGVDFVVRDHGPGISAGRARGLFRAFRKSAQEAAHTAPGIGLGLALSRRLAKDLGGQLRLDPAIRDGAAFVLTVPAAGPGKNPCRADH